MPNYRIEALVYSREKNLEDKLEQLVLTNLYDNDCTGCQVVSFVVYPTGGA